MTSIEVLHLPPGNLIEKLAIKLGIKQSDECSHQWSTRYLIGVWVRDTGYRECVPVLISHCDKCGAKRGSTA